MTIRKNIGLAIATDFQLLSRKPGSFTRFKNSILFRQSFPTNLINELYYLKSPKLYYNYNTVINGTIY